MGNFFGRHTENPQALLFGLLGVLIFLHFLVVLEGVAEPSADLNRALAPPTGLPSMENLSPGISGRVVEIYDEPKFQVETIPFGAASNLAGFEDWELGDLNGDGKSDILLVAPGGILHVLFLEPNKTLRTLNLVPIYQGEKILALGDLNEDGNDDVLLWHSTEQKLRIGTSQGDGNIRFSEQMHFPIEKQIDSGFIQPPFQGEPAKIIFTTRPYEHAYAVEGNSLKEVEYLKPNSELWPLGYSTDPAFHDINRDGRVDVINSPPVLESHAWIAVGAEPKATLFAGLPEDGWVSSFLPVELNGDGRGDFLAGTQAGAQNWIAVYSLGSYAVEVAIPSPFHERVNMSLVRSGDLDGDGFSDLLVPSRESSILGPRLILARRIPPRGIKGVQLRIVGSEFTLMSDEDGFFFVPEEYLRSVSQNSASPDVLRLVPEKSEYAFEPPQREIFIPKSRQRNSPLLFAGANQSPQSRETGRQVNLIGDPEEPKVCLGYYPQGPNMGQRRMSHIAALDRLKWIPTVALCPENYAMLGVGRVRRRFDGSLFGITRARCCPLPRRDILLDEFVETDHRCPEGFLATGLIEEPEIPRANAPRLRCRKVNLHRYQLSDPRPGVFWGYSFGMRGEKNRVSRVKIPLAFRRGAGRESFRGDNAAGCFGGPEAAILTSISGDSCSSHDFRRLFYTGKVPGDPVAGTPVQIFPDCEAMIDEYDPRRGCYRRSPSVGPTKSGSE